MVDIKLLLKYLAWMKQCNRTREYISTYYYNPAVISKILGRTYKL